jgi:alkylation response protein AidB-like acyl-CoA dehydrogenase
VNQTSNRLVPAFDITKFLLEHQDKNNPLATYQLLFNSKEFNDYRTLLMKFGGEQLEINARLTDARKSIDARTFSVLHVNAEQVFAITAKAYDDYEYGPRGEGINALLYCRRLGFEPDLKLDPMGINTFRQSAQLAPEVRREIFYSDPVGVSAGSANPRGRAVAVEGGYRVTGHWFFASGCMHSSLLHGACKVFDGDTPRRRPNGDQEVRIAYFCPKSDARIIDTWNVSGMRGTGSHDIEAEGVFVPEEHTFSALDFRTRVTGPMNRLHGFDLAGCGFCCVALGVARAAIDEFVALAQVKVPRSSSELLRDRAIVQAQVGEADAVLRSGRALLFNTIGGMWETVLAGGAITERQRSDLRMAMTHAAQSAARATHMVCVAAGTTSIFASSPLERYARDVEVVTRHNQLQFVNYEAVGRTILGLESNSPLF